MPWRFLEKIIADQKSRPSPPQKLNGQPLALEHVICHDILEHLA